MTVKVKWENTLSESIEVKQGIRQGAKLSTMLYKRYNNNILNAMERSNMGAKIGNIPLMAPTCADDIAILATKRETQALLDIVYDITNRDLVKINPTKSDLVPLTKSSNVTSVFLGNEEITQKAETKHLGIMRNSKNNINVDDRLKTGRKTVYALLGSGLHAKRGMSPLVATKIWKTYVIPRILYGIEVMNYTQTDVTKLEKLQLKICKQIQGLPHRTANIAAYILLGIEPMEAVIDKLILTFLGNVLQDENTIEYRILERQLSMAKTGKQCYVSKVIEKLRKYGLPELEVLMKTVPEKLQWKKITKKHIGNYWENLWKEEKLEKSTLKHLNIQQCPLGTPHQVWKTIQHNSIEVKKAETKVRLLTGTYMLQEKKAKFNKNATTEICQICKKEKEDLEHFILTCVTLKPIRDKHMKTLRCYIDSIKKDTFDILQNNGQLLQLIMDSSAHELTHIVHLRKQHHIDIEQITRTLCYSLQVKRSEILSKNNT